MLLEQLKELLKQAEPDIELIKQFFTSHPITENIKTLEQKVAASTAWSSPEHIQNAKTLQQLKNIQETYEQLLMQWKEFPELITLFSADPQELERLQSDIRAFLKAVSVFKITLFLNEPDDNANCFLSINAGAGGTESQDWADMLLRMYLRFCEQQKFQVDIVDFQAGEGAGIKSATLFIRGKNANGLLKSEQGVHRLVRISPFDANKRRHTSFVSVSLLPEVEEVSVDINPADLRIDTFRAGGAGGQHVNKTESAIRITHIPSGIVVQCQTERSQGQNKVTAMKMLAAKLAQKAKEEQAEKMAAKSDKKKIEWGSQIRSYVLHPYKLVKDHRTETESGRPELVLDGDLLPFIESYLLWHNKS
jgi:peptide chain release factor 2